MWTAVSGEPVNEILRTPGWRVSAAPASSPIPWTTLKTPGGKPASATRSQRSEQESGDHSAGFSTTVQPGRERGRRLPGREHERRVPGRDHDRRPARHPHDAVARPVRLPDPLLVRDGEVGVRTEVPRAARDHARAERAEEHRHVRALDRGEPLDVRVDQVGEAMEVRGAAVRAERRPARERLRRRRDGEIRLALAASRDLRDRLGVDRREVDERLGARDALAADEVVGRDLDARDLDAAHRS